MTIPWFAAAMASMPLPGEKGACAELLRAKIARREVKLCVMGLGYVGLPLVHAATDAALFTFGLDTEAERIEALRGGRSYLKHAESSWIQPAVTEGRFIPTQELSCIREADAILICVPTPLTESRDPDLSCVVSATEQITSHLRSGHLICLESTTYPTTTRDVVLPVLERSGLKHGTDFFLAYSPERVDPGNKSWSPRDIPKVVGGLSGEATELATSLYQLFLRTVVPVSSAEVAEAAKVLENTFRAVNIALVNEMKILCQRMGIDIWEVIDAAKTKPFGFQPFYPGPGLGGHCVPIDPFYLTWIARRYGLTSRFIELAGEVNTSMPEHVVETLISALSARKLPVRGSRVAVLGLAYKPDIDDARESPSYCMIDLLLRRGAIVTYNDPHVAVMPTSHNSNLPALLSQELTAEYLSAQDCVVIATAHSDYDYAFIVEHSQIVVDTRNATRDVNRHRDRIVKA